MEPFLSEIRIFPFNFAPKGWAFCNGQSLPINQNVALYSLLGNTFGGTQTTFNLPNLQGRVVVDSGQKPGLSAYTPGQTGGTETVTLQSNQAPSHTHPLMGNTLPGDNPAPGPAMSIAAPETGFYQTSNANLISMSASTLPSVGTGGAHNNSQPYLALNFCIALQGIFPPRQ